MNTIDYFGKELILKPIDKVRVRNVDNSWSVEYRSKMWIFNVWRGEGKYKDFIDAKAKAQALKDQGGIYLLQNIKIEWNVGGDLIEEHPPINDEDIELK